MYVVVGLGNPGHRYAQTRHNFGFYVADAFCRAECFPPYTEKFLGNWTQGRLLEQSLGVLKPMTFMNLSGKSVANALAQTHVRPSHLIVLHDELEIPFGEVRIKKGGGQGGHQGLRSIVQHIHSANFMRIRLGIGRPPATHKGTIADFVLQEFSPLEVAQISHITQIAIQAVHQLILSSIQGGVG